MVTCALQKHVGENTLAAYGKQIAKLIGKTDWNLFTSLTFRRTVDTVCADAGMTLPQLKSTMGHKSDRVVQRYIDNSMLLQKRTSADALTVSGIKKKKMIGEIALQMCTILLEVTA